MDHQLRRHRTSAISSSSDGDGRHRTPGRYDSKVVTSPMDDLLESVFLYQNNFDTSYRKIVDRLPHEARRYLHRKYCPSQASTLQTIRQHRPDQPDFDLSSFLEHQAIYIHVPKVAGRTIGKQLFSGLTGTHTTLYCYSLAFNRREFKSFFKFAFVRNPWDRLYSAYRYLMAGGSHPGDAALAERYLSPYKDFEDFVLNGLHQPPTKRVLHMLPASHFMEIRPGLMPLNFIGYFEQLSQDMTRVADRLGVSLSMVSRENRSPGEESDYRNAYTAEMIRKVAAFYERDIDLLGYGFDDFTPHRLNRTLP